MQFLCGLFVFRLQYLLMRLFRQIGAGVIIAWGHTIYEQFGFLAGKSAPHEFLQLIIYKAMTFSGEIDKIDTVRAYHVSSQSQLRSVAR